MVIFEPVQNAGGCFTPPEGYWRGVRELCDGYDILLCADEVITGFGRLGSWFGSELYDIRPDLITSAKGLSSSYAAIGAVIASDRVMEPFMDGSRDVHARHHVRRPSGRCRDRAEEHRDHEAGAHRRACRGTQSAFRATLEQLLDLPIVGDVRGTGFFYAIELVKDKETRETFNDEECETLLRGFLSPGCSSAGSSAALTTAATRSSRSRRRSLPDSRNSTRSCRFSATSWPRPGRVCIDDDDARRRPPRRGHQEL